MDIRIEVMDNTLIWHVFFSIDFLFARIARYNFAACLDLDLLYINTRDSYKLQNGIQTRVGAERKKDL